MRNLTLLALKNYLEVPLMVPASNKRFSFSIYNFPFEVHSELAGAVAPIAQWNEMQMNEKNFSRAISDNEVLAIWVRFNNRQRIYNATHVFKHPNGPYILLSSLDKNHSDFKRVLRNIVKAWGGTTENCIADRGNDICSVIRISAPLTVLAVLNKITSFYQKSFNNALLAQFHYKDRRDEFISRTCL